MVTNLPAMQEPQEMQVRFLDLEDPLEEGTATHSRIPRDGRAWWATVHGMAKS